MPLKVGASIPLLTFVVDLFTSNWMLLTKVSSSEHIAGLGVHVEWNAHTSRPEMNSLPSVKRRCGPQQLPAKSGQTTLESEPQTGPFLRAELVGKFPHIRHLPAPKGAKLKISLEAREHLLADMMLR